MTSADLLFACVRYSVCGLEMKDEEKSAVNPQALQALYELSIRHDMAHIVCDALQKNGLLPDGAMGQMFRRQKDLAVYRYLQQSAALDEICAVLEEAGIAHVPLKGSVIRNYYPEPWMRTSCDIDILVHEEELKRTISLLNDRLGYRTEAETGFHHASLYSRSGVHLELHFQIKEGVGISDEVLGRVWENVVPVLGKQFRYAMTGEFFLFYHLAHMSRHFMDGGCGIRPFVDYFILHEKMPYDNEHFEELLERGGLRKFSDAVFSCGAAWLSGSPMESSQMDHSIQDYILTGGVYGTLENSIRTQQGRKGSAAKNILHRLWIPYEALQIGYGVPAGRKYLLPFYQVKRWFVLVFRKKRLRYGLSEIGQNMTVSDSERAAAREMLTHLGLVEER